MAQSSQVVHHSPTSMDKALSPPNQSILEVFRMNPIVEIIVAGRKNVSQAESLATGQSTLSEENLHSTVTLLARFRG